MVLVITKMWNSLPLFVKYVLGLVCLIGLIILAVYIGRWTKPNTQSMTYDSNIQEGIENVYTNTQNEVSKQSPTDLINMANGYGREWMLNYPVGRGTESK
jgi:hypothetical protein